MSNRKEREEMISLSLADLDVRELEHRLELAAQAAACDCNGGCDSNCGTNCSSNDRARC